MARHNIRPFAPVWLRCAGCAIAMIPFPVAAFRLLFGSATEASFIALLPITYVFVKGLELLTSGRCSGSILTFAANTICGQICAKQDDRARGAKAPTATLQPI